MVTVKCRQLFFMLIITINCNQALWIIIKSKYNIKMLQVQFKKKNILAITNLK